MVPGMNQSWRASFPGLYLDSRERAKSQTRGNLLKTINSSTGLELLVFLPITWADWLDNPHTTSEINSNNFNTYLLSKVLPNYFL